MRKMMSRTANQTCPYYNGHCSHNKKTWASCTKDEPRQLNFSRLLKDCSYRVEPEEVTDFTVEDATVKDTYWSDWS